MSVNEFSSDFFKPSTGSYLLTHSIGLQPKATAKVLEQKFHLPWQSGAEDIWPQWLDHVHEFKQSLANLLNSNAAQFCPQVNISGGLSKVLSGITADKSKCVILASERDFPSVGFVLKQAEKLGFKVRLMASDSDTQDVNTWDEALTDDVAIALITHVHYSTNNLVPSADITALCRAREIISIVDLAQALGIVPIDLASLAADVVLGSCIKWLCGGPGAGFLWLDSDILDSLEPSDVGWFSHQNPFEFDIHHFRYAKSAARFWGGTPSVTPFIAAQSGIKLLSKIGIENISEHNRRLSKKILDSVPENVVASPLDLDKKGGTTVLKFANQKQVEAKLKSEAVLFDSREYGLRLSPHIYTTDEEIDQLIDLLK